MNIAAYPTYESYKPTGVEWAPEAPDHWDIKPIAAAARVISEANQPDLELLSVYLGKGVIRFSDVDAKRTNATSLDLSKYQIVRPGNLVLNNQQAWRGSVGVSKHTGIVSPAYLVLDLKGSFDRRFADYYFQTTTTVSHFLVSSKGVGTIQRNLYWPALRRCPVTIPPLPEQRAIAAFLDGKCATIDEAMRIKEEQIRLLAERRQILIQQAVTRGLNPDAPMKDSGIDWIGQIPKHWKQCHNKFIFALTKKLVGKRAPKYNLLSLTLRGIIKRDMENPEGKFPAEFDTYQEVAPGDFVFCHFDVEETPRTIGLSPFFGMITGAYTVYRPAEDVNPRFLMHFYIFADTGKKMRGMYKGLRNTISKDSFASFKTPLPPREEQDAIVEHIDDQSRKIDAAIAIKESQTSSLREYKTSLIDAAVTGKIKVI